MRILPFLFLLACICSACGPTVIYEEEVQLPETGWAYPDSTHFQFSITEPETAYNFVLHLEHGTDFPYQNFYIKLHTGFPNGKRNSQQLSLQLAGAFGAWKGDCSGTSCNLDITFLKNARFEQSGDYYLTVEQHSREPVLGAIESIGFSVEEAE
ncbi:MAG: gliding motility lipoprotein GldH [Lewinella sp.]